MHGEQISDADLIRSFPPELYLQGKNTAYEYASDRILHPSTQDAIRILNGKKKGNRTAARQWLLNLRQMLETGSQWTFQSPTVEIPFLKGKLQIDGFLTEPEWNESLCWMGDFPVSSREHLENGSRWHIVHDSEYLYFGAAFLDEEIVVHPEKYFRGDSLEIFLLADPRMKSYWELIITPSGKHYSAWNIQNGNGTFSSVKHILPETCRIAAQKTPDGFSVEAAFPLSALPTLKRDKNSIRFILIRTHNIPASCDRLVFHTPVPFLYEGHNLNGYLTGILLPSTKIIKNKKRRLDL